MHSSGSAPDNSHTIRPLWLNRRRFVKAIQAFLTSDVGGRAKSLFVLLLTLLVAINGLNVVNSYVGRDFMTAIEQHDKASFVREAIFYLAVFAASTAVAVFARFAEERLALLWREWLTRRQVAHYLYVSVGDEDEPLGHYDAVLLLASDGSWTCNPIDASKAAAVAGSGPA